MAINAGARHPSDVFVSLHGTCFVLVGPSLSALHTRPALRCLCSLLPFGAGGQNAECFPLGSAKCLDWEVPTGTILNEQNFADILQTHNFLDNTAVPPPPLVLRHPLSLPREGWGTVTCSTQSFSLQLTVLLWQNHHPRRLPKAFQWKLVSMSKSSRSSGAGPRKFTLSWSRIRSPYIGSPLNVSYAEFFCIMLQFLCLQMCVYVGSAVPQGGVGDRHLVTVPQGVVGDRLPWGEEGQGGGEGMCNGGFPAKNGSNKKSLQLFVGKVFAGKFFWRKMFCSIFILLEKRFLGVCFYF